MAGLRASHLGLKACVVEKEHCGGVCLNCGCIPSKGLIHQAEIFHSRRNLEEMGIAINTEGFDYGRVQRRSREAIPRLKAGVEFLLKEGNVDLIRGVGQIVGPNEVRVSDGAVVQGKNIIIATGSRPASIAGFEFDEKQVLSSTGVLSMTTLPKSLIVLGGGAIGCEFAYVMNAFGVKVTLVEMMGHLLPFVDEEITTMLENSFRKSGIHVMTSTRSVSLNKLDDGVAVTVDGSDGRRQTIEGEKVLCVFGRKPNSDDIGLQSIGVQTEKGYIPVGDYYQTAVKGVFAIGDVVATPSLAHVASREGEIAVDYIAGRKPEPRINADVVPFAIYCEPQVASFGLGEAQAKEKQIRYEKTIFPYRAVGKAVVLNKSEGVAKLLYDPDSREILGCHIIGHQATELIHEVLLAKSSELLPQDIARMIHAHPTMSEVVMGMMTNLGG